MQRYQPRAKTLRASLALLTAGSFSLILLSLVPPDSQHTLLGLLWLLWFVACAYAWQRRVFSLALAGLLAAMLFYVVIPATQDVIRGNALVGGNDYPQGIHAALIMAILAQLGTLGGAVTADGFARRSHMVRTLVYVSPARLDRLVLKLFGVGIVGLVLFIAVGHASPRAALAIAGKGYYGGLETSATSTKILYFISLEGVAGVALVILILRMIVSIQPRIRLFVALVTISLFLLAGGQRARFAIPAVAGAMLLGKYGRWRRIGPRSLIMGGTIALLFVSAVVGVARGGPGHRNFSLSSLSHTQFGGASDLFAPTAGLAVTVPSRVPYIHALSYLEVIAFPIPRAMWSGKPQGEEAALANMIDNRSGSAFPEYGEFYHNFGLLGVLVGSFGLCFLIEAAWLRFARTPNPRMAVTYAVAIAVLLQLFTRGDAATVISGAFGLIVGTLYTCWPSSHRLGRTTKPGLVSIAQ